MPAYKSSKRTEAGLSVGGTDRCKSNHCHFDPRLTKKSLLNPLPPVADALYGPYAAIM